VTAEFLVTSLIIVVTPGIGVLYTMAAGLSRGARAGVVAAVACTLGIVPHMLAALTGLAALLNASAVAFETFRLLGVGYLLYLAWRTWRDRGSLAIETTATERSTRDVLVTGVVVNLLNPKLTLFFFAFLPQFVDPADAGYLVRMAELSGVFMLLTLVVFIGYGVFAAAIRRHVAARPGILTWLRRTFAAAFVVLGLRLAFERR
jgi:threonine/homoserine/homoserine lactone efflux protein